MSRVMYFMDVPYSPYVCAQLSGQVIRQCAKAIKLDHIFEGNVRTSVQTLNECIVCCEQWKELYRWVSYRLYRLLSSTDE